jgi:DNA polymerase III epsilon subunit-like protein
MKQEKLAEEILNLIEDSTIWVAHNAQFDILFLLELLKEYKLPQFAYVDTLTIYKDRRAYPHKLANAIKEYGLEDKVVNSHRAIDDVIALMEVLKKMREERDDLHQYVNVFGYHPKYGISGRKIQGITYFPQKFNPGLTREEETLPALSKKEQVEYTQISFDL